MMNYIPLFFVDILLIHVLDVVYVYLIVVSKRDFLFIEENLHVVFHH